MHALANIQSYPALDRAFLARFTMGNTALELEVLGLFAAQSPNYLARMLDAGCQTEWKEAAHTLKGSAAAVGARRVAQLAEQVERVAYTADPAARSALLAPLKDALDETRLMIMSLPRD